MQKEKISKFVLMALLLGTAHAARAEDPSAFTSNMDQNSTLGDMIKHAKQAGEREFVTKINSTRKNSGNEAATDHVMEKNPVLLALYGTELNYKAELDVNGQSRIVLVPGPLQKMGPWKYITLMEEGVLLTKNPQSSTATVDTRTAGARSSGRLGVAMLACQQKETCLFLSVPKGGDDSRSPVVPDAQAHLLANQFPNSRAPAPEFGGKPQPPGNRININNTAPASR